MSQNPPRIYLSPPHIGSAEQAFVKEAFDTNWIAPLGPHVDGFEDDIRKFTGAAHVAALSSGTAALHLSLKMLGIKAGDKVICQSLTFVASANPIVYLGAIPVFIDSEAETWNMCPNALEQALKTLKAKNRLPAAIIPVHSYGMPAKMSEITELATHYGIPVVEDAAEALGSEIDGRKCGTLGKLGVVSFNGNKIITTGGGGALLSDDGEMIRKARFLSTQAREPGAHYQHRHIGYNYRMSNVLAGIGRGQMQVLEDRILQRRANFGFYHDLLGRRPGISFLAEPGGFFSNRWLTAILVDPQKTGGISAKSLRLELEKQNIEARPFWKPLHLQPVFEKYPFFGGNIAEKLFECGLCLPSGSGMTEDDKKRIAQTLNDLMHPD